MPTIDASRAPSRRAALLRRLEQAQPRVLYGLRMMGSVTLAMWVAFWMQLQNASWAPVTAAIVCQPTIGASLRKGQFRVVGTCAGATAIVVLTALMPQSRIGLLAGLTLWAMIAGFMATILRNSAAYAASLAGYTAVIVFSDAVDSTPNDVFTLAVTRATEISIGVISAGLVLSATDTGDARRRLAGRIAALLDGIGRGLADTLRAPGPGVVARRRELIGDLARLDPLVDEALGETADLRYRAAALQGGTDGTLRALAAWTDISIHLSAPGNRSERRLGVLATLERGLDRLGWLADPAGGRDLCRALSAALSDADAGTVSERLLMDRTAAALSGLARAGNALALLVDPDRAERDRARRRVQVPDLFVALANALRVGATVLAGTAIWIELAWPGGQDLMVFGAVITILFAPQADVAHKVVPDFALGVCCAAVLAAIVSFAVLPGQQSYLALILAIGAVMAPAAAMAAGTWHRFVFTAICFIFLALLAPSNQQSYDLSSFLNGAAGIVGGVLVGLLGFRLVPPVGPDWKVRRLLALTLRDVRRFAARRRLGSGRGWTALIIARAGTLPPGADPADRARLVAGFSAGAQVLALWRGMASLRRPELLPPALAALSAGRVEQAIEALRLLAGQQPVDASGLRARVEIVLLSDVLARHEAFFADRGRRPVPTPRPSAGMRHALP